MISTLRPISPSAGLTRRSSLAAALSAARLDGRIKSTHGELL